MSSSAQGAPRAPAVSTVPTTSNDDKKKGLSRVLGRMKTVLKRGDGSKRLSFVGKSSTTGTTGGPSVPKSTDQTSKSKPISTPTPEPSKEIPASIPAVVETKQTTTTTTKTTTPSATKQQQSKSKSQPQLQPQPQPTKVSRAEINAERARKLAERFQLQIEPHEWQSLTGEKDVWRIEKPIRMRIHRTCHKCDTTYGANKICTNCEHPRCTKCPRFPLKKKEKGKTAVASTGPTKVEVDREWKKAEKLIMTLPSHKVGGQPLVRKKPTQRVKRTCHECSTLFTAGNKICTTCAHTRCADCPRNPSKKKKYPDGYPGDQPSSTNKKFACHKCDKTFPHHSSSDSKTSMQECTSCSAESDTGAGSGGVKESGGETKGFEY
ncbi:uncharacterized protein Bfra_006155 [Botrytis fragariae]|uniref:Uncharacterized protein n=1 Tax=Botrytis fragariae TaxID=1964551 RepID=A0A8H6EHT4_9HELO|nr:uncharacterized protein Bfra_006155 [Botrytis fragariae]KAF5872792.1 hypothetical protein Bfra_006155 [Botrytis fragariae]